MEYAKKMVVVPQELISRLEKASTPHSTHSSSREDDLSTEMKRILDNRVMSDSDKWKQYQQVLRRFLHLAATNRQPITMPIVERESDGKVVDYDEAAIRPKQPRRDGDTMIEDIIESLPTAYKTETRGLLRAMVKRPDLIRWDSNGTVYTNDEMIPNSNIIDIVHNIVRARKTSQVPSGWTQVMSVLRELNVPSTYLGNPRAFDFLGRTPVSSSNLLTPQSTIRHELSLPDTPPYTPLPTRIPSRSTSRNLSSPPQPPGWTSFN